MSRKSQKGYLLATAGGVAVVAAAGGAQAADMPMKAPMLPAPAVSWAGWYIGLSAGANWQHATNTNNSDPYYGALNQAVTTTSGFIGGGQIGYNWQDGNFVYGLEGDISGLTGRGKSVVEDGKYFQNKIDWLSTVRARMGLAVGNTMVYTTGGLAIGGVDNKWTAYGGSKSESKTQLGWTVGAGVEHMIGSNLTIGLEALFVDLGSSSVSLTNGKTAHFSNQAIIGRFKVNYKF